jgi:hypothetical protein
MGITIADEENGVNGVIISNHDLYFSLNRMLIKIPPSGNPLFICAQPNFLHQDWGRSKSNIVR